MARRYASQSRSPRSRNSTSFSPRLSTNLRTRRHSRPRVCTWKYFQPRADWAAPRSWALKDDDGQLVAHLGVGPSTLILPTTTVSTIMMIDWAASRSAPRGTGSRLMEEVCLGMPMQVIVGGTADSQRAFHRLGYARVGTLETYWRTLAPWRRFRETPSPVQPWHVRRLIEDWASDARTKLFGRRWTLERIESFEGYRSLLREPDDCGWTRCCSYARDAGLHAEVSV